MRLIESTSLANMCDYNFGDQASVIHGLNDCFMKSANENNYEFISLCKKMISEGKNNMTLFIDNIRLYNREIISVKPSDKPWVNTLMGENDLLKLCSTIPKIKFIIFTGHEDTPIDDYIFDKIPDNVLSIVAVNAESFGGKVIPLPYGLQRKLTLSDDRLNIMIKAIKNTSLPSKLLYVNHSISTNITERMGINELFFNKSWATVDSSRTDYATFINKIKNHKFMICPIGNAIDCHRNWEVLYLKRVPIMKKNKYLEELFIEFPVLFVNDYSEINEELLIRNENLFNKAINLSLEKLNLIKLFNKHLGKFNSNYDNIRK